MKQLAGEGHFYQLYFQEPGKAEAELEADVRKSMRMLLYSASGDASPEKRWRFLFNKSETFLDTGVAPERLPAWLAEADLDFFVGEFERTGFRGGLNWYRNIDALWESTPFLSGAKICQPSLFIAGELDPVITISVAVRTDSIRYDRAVAKRFKFMLCYLCLRYNSFQGNLSSRSFRKRSITSSSGSNTIGHEPFKKST